MISEQAWLYGQMEPGENRPLQGDPVHIDRVMKRIHNYSSSNNYKMEFGSWKVGKHPSTVISDTKVRNTNFPVPPNDPESADREAEYYGGYLVAESIGNPEMARLIAAAPQMLAALQKSLECFLTPGSPTYKLVAAAIASATGIDPTPDII